MKTKSTPKVTKIRKFVVKHPATAKDFRRIYGIKNGMLKAAKKLEKELCEA